MTLCDRIPSANTLSSGETSLMSIAEPVAGSSAGSTRTEASMTVNRSSMSAYARVATSKVCRSVRRARAEEVTLGQHEALPAER